MKTPAAGSWMMIVDNADDERVLDADAESAGLLHYLPRSDQGSTLFTTRSHEVAQSVAGQDGMVLRPESLRDEKATTELLVGLDNFPLALAQAGAYKNVNHNSAAEYVDLIAGTEEDRVEVMSEGLGDKTRYRQSENAVATPWIITFQQIAARDQHAAELSQCMLCMEWKAIPASILQQAGFKAQMARAIGMLRSYSFLARRPDEKTYDMHRLVHLARRVWDRRYGSPGETLQKVVLHLSSTFPFGEHEKRDIWRAYLPHAARLQKDSAERSLNDKGRRYKLVGYCLQVDDRAKEAVSWLEKSWKN